MRSLFIAMALLAPAAAHADVATSASNGFVVRHAADVDAAPADVWAELIRPAGWWSARHSYSGDAANLTLDARAGGCFCEVLPSPVSPRAAPRGSVEHMRVAYAEHGRVLRMIGGLGPLQAEAVNGALTIALKPVDGGTRIMWEYVVGGYMRQGGEQLAPMVDGVLGEQLTALAAKLGPRAPSEPAGDAAAPKAGGKQETAAEAKPEGGPESGKAAPPKRARPIEGR